MLRARWRAGQNAQEQQAAADSLRQLRRAIFYKKLTQLFGNHTQVLVRRIGITGTPDQVADAALTIRPFAEPEHNMLIVPAWDDVIQVNVELQADPQLQGRPVEGAQLRRLELPILRGG
jgi:hypothetical protein